MDLTHLLPYEILQLISSKLLPRYQCRFAMASQHHYRYLYNDMLRWHVRVAPIKHMIKHTIFGNYSLVMIGANLLCYELYRYDEGCILSAHNITTGREHRIPAMNRFRLIHPDNIIFNITLMHTIKVFDGFYKNINGRTFSLCASMRMSPFISLPHNILHKILCYFEREEYKNEYEILLTIHPYTFQVYYFDHTIEIYLT